MLRFGSFQKYMESRAIILRVEWRIIYSAARRGSRGGNQYKTDMPFQKGHKYAKGGKHGGNQGGRPPNDFVAEFAARCRAALDKSKAIEYLQAVAAGERTETYVTELGYCVKVRAGARDRRECIKLLMDRGLGMAA